jgi:ABC-type multidrug transport system ATPase subunit
MIMNLIRKDSGDIKIFGKDNKKAEKDIKIIYKTNILFYVLFGFLIVFAKNFYIAAIFSN